MTSGARRLRTLLNGDRLIVAPGIFDGLSAAAVRAAGFPAAYMTGAGVSASAWGLPDIGLLTATEMAERARTLAELVEVPLIADADTGYGSPLNLVRTVRNYEAAGVAAIQLEDQTFPKRCGHLDDKAVIAVEEFVMKLAAALEARDEMLVIARTDALGPLGLDEAIERAQRYAEAGADIVFVEAPESVAQLERIGAAIDAPLLLNVVPGGRTPAIEPERARALGYRIAIHPGAGLVPATRALQEAYAALAASAAVAPPPTGPESFFALLGLADWADLGRRFDVKKEVQAWA